MDSPNTSNLGGDDEPIYHSAISCGVLFEKLLTQSARNNGEHYATVRDYHLRFDHWVGFVGALADEKASLDTRLNHYPDIRDLVLQMLRMLYSNLHHAALHFQPPTTTKAKLDDDEIDNREEDPTSSLSSTLAIRAALDAAQEAIDRLQRLATVIRRSSTATISSRVKNFALKSDAAENAEFNRLIRLRIKGILPEIGESLANQLLESILHRRLRLLYQRRHQKKLGRHRPARSNHPLPKEPNRENQHSEPPLQQVTPEPDRRKVASMASVYSKSQANSGTAHSTFDLSAFQHYQTQEDSVPSDNITVTSVAQGYSYPSAPKPRDGILYARCDWCFEEILPSQSEAPGWWRSHFKRDLQPYVCISEDCVDPPIYFTSFSLWRKHMEGFHTVDWARKTHSPSVWYCDLEPDEYREFGSADKLREHITSAHGTALSEVQLARKLTRSVLPSPRKENICPLCNQDVLKAHDPTTEPGVKGGETPSPAKRSKKARFGDLDDSLSSEDEASSRQTTQPVEPGLNPGQSNRDMAAVRRQKVAMHVASHLKSLSFLSIRYMEGDSASVKSEDAALGIDHDASDQERLSDIFPLSDSPLEFEDIPLDKRPADEEVSGDQDASLNIDESPSLSPDDVPDDFKPGPRWLSHKIVLDYVLDDVLDDVLDSPPLDETSSDLPVDDKKLDSTPFSGVEGQKWQHIVDNSFAANVIDSATELVPQPTTSLCQICTGIDITKSDFSVEYTLDHLRRSSETCNLCSLLLRVVKEAPEWNSADDSTHTVLFCKDASILRLGAKGPPALSLCAGPGLPPSMSWTQLRGIQLGFPTLNEPQNPKRFKLLQQFLQHCDQNHSCIRTKHSHAWMPTRVIDVENLRLVYTDDLPNQEKEDRRYMVLSYMYGDTKQQVFTTTNTNLEQLQNGFRLDALSATIQDAVTVTKHLGIRFLWVDRICIIQGDDADEALELASFDEIYRNAYCVLAATSAQTQSEGFLQPRPPRTFVSFDTPAGFPTSVCELIDDFQREVDGAPLNQLGWAFQDRLLSRRTIHFARNQFYWQCGEGIRCETLTKLSHPLDILCGDSDFPKTCLRKIQPQFRVHQMLYELFSRLKLPREEDRAVAIAKIQRLIAKETQTSVWHGVFRDEMARGLLWKRADDEATLRPIKFSRILAVPAWSWMRYSGAIAYVNVPVNQSGFRWEAKVKDEYSSLGFHQLSVRGYFSEGIETMKAVYDVPMKGGRRNIDTGIVMATYEPEDGDYARDYILIVEPAKRDGEFGWERIGVGELERPKTKRVARQLGRFFLT